jgi:hypothetical protein
VTYPFKRVRMQTINRADRHAEQSSYFVAINPMRRIQIVTVMHGAQESTDT